MRGTDAELFARLRAGGDAAVRGELTRRHLPLARRLARRYARGDESMDDLVQVAAVGLVLAIDRYDPDRGAAFTSFAVPTVLGELRRYFRDHGWQVRPPRDLQETVLKVDRATAELQGESGRPPTVAQLAEHLGLPDERVLEALEAASVQRTSSLDAPRTADEDDGTLGDRLGREDGGFHRAEEAATLERLVSVLDPREREILHLRFAEDLTQSEIGERLGISQMHVSRLIRRSLQRLQAIAANRPPSGD